MQYHTRVPNRLQGYDYSQNGASGKIRGHAQPCAFAAFDPGRRARIARPYGFQHRPTMKELRNQTPPSPHLAVHRFQPPNMADGLPEPEPEQTPTI